MMSRRLLVKNVDVGATEEQIERLFSVYGDVHQVFLNRQKGIGMIEMASDSEAIRARERLQGEPLWGRSLDILAMGNSLKSRISYMLNRYF